MRLFPKGMGSLKYRITGLASLCDWVVVTDLCQPKSHIIANTQRQPRTVFLSLRSRFKAISYFHKQVLPRIQSNFILVSGSSDLTIPNQTDSRWPKFSASERRTVDEILEDERLIHWFTENLDENLPKISPLPTGALPTLGELGDIAMPGEYAAISDRPLKALCCHRNREGAQWQARRHVTEYCSVSRKHLTTVVKSEIGISQFRELVRAHPLVLCVEGGGLDPSPKAWEAMMMGAIPVVRKSPTSVAYSELPVAFIEDWRGDFLEKDKMEEWIAALEPFFQESSLRENVSYQLSLEYWWEKVVNAFMIS